MSLNQSLFNVGFLPPVLWLVQNHSPNNSRLKLTTVMICFVCFIKERQDIGVHVKFAMYEEGSLIWIHSFFEKIKRNHKEIFDVSTMARRETQALGSPTSQAGCPAWKQGVGPRQTMQFHLLRQGLACWYNFEKQRRKDEFLVSKQELKRVQLVMLIWLIEVHNSVCNHSKSVHVSHVRILFISTAMWIHWRNYAEDYLLEARLTQSRARDILYIYN